MTENSHCKVITKCDRSLLQSALGTKFDDCYHKVHQVLQSDRLLLQSATVIAKWDVTPLRY